MRAGADILAIETRAFDAWPAEEIVPLDGWRLRHTRGMTRRGNSVWTLGGDGRLPLDERIARVERFYDDRGLPATFQVTASLSGQLDRALAARGYAHDADVAVETASARAVIDATSADPPPGLRVHCEPRLFEGWFDLSARRGRFAETQDIYRALLLRLEGRAVFALAERDGTPAAVALGVRGGRWLGVFSMLTVHDCRRLGCGRALLGALARLAIRGAQPESVSLYLQVETSNRPARALYRAAGFEPRYEYHYRVR